MGKQSELKSGYIYIYMSIQMPTARWKCDGDSFTFRHHLLPTNFRYYVDALFTHTASKLVCFLYLYPKVLQIMTPLDPIKNRGFRLNHCPLSYRIFGDDDKRRLHLNQNMQSDESLHPSF